MSIMASTRVQKRDKNSSAGGKLNTHKVPQATAEQMRLAQLVNEPKDEDLHMTKKAAQIVEVTGTSEDNALLALYDSGNDPNRAIELILERGSMGQDNGWETAGRKKNRGCTSVSRGVDIFEDECKNDKTNDTKCERAESRGRGRHEKGRNQDHCRTSDDNDKENEVIQVKSKGRRGGRGRGKFGASRGRGNRQYGRGAPRHFKNLSSGCKEMEGFGSFDANKNSLTEPVDIWKGADTECWDIEVGTWSSEDVQNQKVGETKKDKHGNNWGRDSWNDDLTESRVFQARNIPLSGSMPDGVSARNTNEATINHISHTAPQMGERIDLGTLFKKSGSAGTQGPLSTDLVTSYNTMAGIGYDGSATTQQATADVIQKLQQQGQSNSLFSENNHVGSSANSRLFSSYDGIPQQTQSATQSFFDSSKAQGSIENQYSQFNGKVGQRNQAENSSSFLNSFSGLKTSGSTLGQLTDLSSKQSALSSYSQVRPKSNETSSVRSPAANTFSQGQQQQATDAVKASLGMPVRDAAHFGSILSGQMPPNLSRNTNELGRLSPVHNLSVNEDMNKNDPHLSFGSPLPPQLHHQNKQRRKMPTLPSKIPASAVEMPGSNAYNSKEYSNFSLQFGADDSASPLETNLPSSDYGAVVPQNKPQNVIPQQSSLFLNNDVSESNSLSNGADSSLFGQTTQKLVNADTDAINSENMRLSSQRLNDADQSSRAPPGLTMPTTASSAFLPMNGSETASSHISGSHLESNLVPAYGGSSQQVAGEHSRDSSLNQASSSLSSSFSQQVHSYYSSSAHDVRDNLQHQPNLSSSSGRNMCSPIPSSSLPGSLQSSPMPQSKVTHGTGNTPAKDKSSETGCDSSSLASSMSSLATSLSQVSISSSVTMQHHVSGTSILNQSSMLSTALSTVSNIPPYSTTLSSTESISLDDSTASSVGVGYGASQESVTAYSSYPLATPSLMYNAAAVHTPTQQVGQQSEASTAVSTVSAMSLAPFNPQATSTSTTMGGFASSKPAHPMSNKGPPNIPPGATAPMLQSQYGIPMAGLMPYAPDMAYGYDQLLLQSRVINPLNYYDMHFHNNTQSATISGRDPTAGMGTTATGQGKYSRGEPSSPTAVGQLSLSGSIGSTLSQHNASASQQNARLKGSQAAAHHSAQQQFVGAMPAYAAGYGSLAPPYYGLGMANTAGFQYPPAMFAAAMHQAPKHSVNTTSGFQQGNSGFSHSYSSAATTSSASGINDLPGSSYSKTHASAFEKQQGYHHANTPPPFNLQALTAAVAAGGGAGASGAAPGLSPYAAGPYMTMLQPHQPSQQQAIHLLQQQHQDASGAQSVGSQRNLGSNSIAKSVNKPSSYGSAPSGYWGN